MPDEKKTISEGAIVPWAKSISNNSKPQQRLGGTTAATLLAMTQGIRIHRVHDVQEINQALIVFERLFNR